MAFIAWLVIGGMLWIALGLVTGMLIGAIIVWADRGQADLDEHEGRFRGTTQPIAIAVRKGWLKK